MARNADRIRQAGKRGARKAVSLGTRALRMPGLRGGNSRNAELKNALGFCQGHFWKISALLTEVGKPKACRRLIFTFFAHAGQHQRHNGNYIRDHLNDRQQLHFGVDVIEKNMILLGISRKLFTHSLPLVVAEQCYEKLLVDARTLIMDTKISRKQEKAYGLLINIIDDYNLRLLSTKIYWDKPSEREEYKKFYAEYKNINQLKEKSYMEYSKNKEILFLKRELEFVYKNINRYCRIIKFYKRKLVALGAMKELKNSCISEENYTKIKSDEVLKREKVVI